MDAFWAEEIARGAKVRRFLNNADSVRLILAELAGDQRVVLQVQKELVQQDKKNSPKQPLQRL